MFENQRRLTFIVPSASELVNRNAELLCQIRQQTAELRLAQAEAWVVFPHGAQDLPHGKPVHGLDLTGLRRKRRLRPVEDEEIDPCDLIVMERLSMEGSVIFVALGKQEFRLLSRYAQLLGQLI